MYQSRDKNGPNVNNKLPQAFQGLEGFRSASEQVGRIPTVPSGGTAQPSTSAEKPDPTPSPTTIPSTDNGSSSQPKNPIVSPLESSPYYTITQRLPLSGSPEEEAVSKLLRAIETDQGPTGTLFRGRTPEVLKVRLADGSSGTVIELRGSEGEPIVRFADDKVFQMIFLGGDAQGDAIAAHKGVRLGSGEDAREDMIVYRLSSVSELDKTRHRFICLTEHELTHLNGKNLDYVAYTAQERCLERLGLPLAEMYGPDELKAFKKLSPEDRRMAHIMTNHPPRYYIAALLDRFGGEVSAEFVTHLPEDNKNQYSRSLNAVRQFATPFHAQYQNLKLSDNEVIEGVRLFLTYRDIKTGIFNSNDLEYKENYNKRVDSLVKKISRDTELLRWLPERDTRGTN